MDRFDTGKKFRQYKLHCRRIGTTTKRPCQGRFSVPFFLTERVARFRSRRIARTGLIAISGQLMLCRSVPVTGTPDAGRKAGAYLLLLQSVDQCFTQFSR